MKRWDVFIELLRKRAHCVGAEIGVQGGKTTFRLLSALPGLTMLYCVDPWLCYPDYELDRVKTGDEWPSQRMLDRDRGHFMSRLPEFEGRVTVLEMVSARAAGHVEDESLDFGIIDANHLYEYVKQDILAWLPKLKAGGTLVGHDYEYPVKAWGVKRAVTEIFGNRVVLGPCYTWWVPDARAAITDT